VDDAGKKSEGEIERAAAKVADQIQRRYGRR
jgi:hypothetical protein